MKKAMVQRYNSRSPRIPEFKAGDVLSYRDERTGCVMHASVLDDASVEGFCIVLDERTGRARRVPIRVYKRPSEWLRSCIPSSELCDLSPSTLLARFRLFRESAKEALS